MGPHVDVCLWLDTSGRKAVWNTVIWMGRNLPVGSGIVVCEWEELLLNLVPALQAAPKPVRVDHMEVLTLLCLAHLLCACRDNMSDCLPWYTSVGVTYP